MVDFNFTVNDLFTSEITAVRSDLIPAGYSGHLNHSLVQHQVSCWGGEEQWRTSTGGVKLALHKMRFFFVPVPVWDLLSP